MLQVYGLFYVQLHMPIRLMCLLFKGDLTVTENIPLCSLPTHTRTPGIRIPGNSIGQVNRQGSGGWKVIRYGKNRRFLISLLLLFNRKLEKGPNCSFLPRPPWFLPFIAFSIGKNIIQKPKKNFQYLILCFLKMSFDKSAKIWMELGNGRKGCWEIKLSA